ncbi:MAG TPA: hypothetical protein VF609_11130 [Flavisolibacter sp.]
MKGPLLFTALLLCASCTYSQSMQTPISAIYPSLHTYSVQFKDAFSFRGNSASLAGIKQFSAGVFSERRFLLQELSNYSFAAALPTISGNFGVKGDYFGGEHYKEITLGLGYGRKVGDRLDIGVAFNYFSVNTSGYGSASAVTFDAGAIIHLTDAVQTGVHLYNPVGMKMGKAGTERLPAIYSVGLGYDASSQLFIGAEVVKTEDQPVSVKAGLQYVFDDKLIARSGISSASSVYYLGFGVKLKNLRLDITSSFHPYLGVTPGLLVIYSPRQ